ncbi:MAG: hypothetical protein AAGG00_08615 [Cyanobacteria bacterium P01_H01_bin.150]
MKSYKDISLKPKQILLSIAILSSFTFSPIQSVFATDICSRDEKSSEIEEACKKIEEFELKEALLEAEKSKREAEIELFKTNLPNTGITSPTGEVDFGDNGFDYESTILAYGEMAKAAQKIGDQISKKLVGDSTILIYPLEVSGDKDVSRLYSLYFLFNRQHKGLIKAYKDEGGIELPESESSLERAAELSLAAGSFINLAQLFNVEQKVRPSGNVNVANDAIAAQIFRVLKKNNEKNRIFYPQIHFYDKMSTDKVVIEIMQLLYLKNKGEEIVKQDISDKRKDVIKSLNKQNAEFLKSISLTDTSQTIINNEIENVIISLAKGAKLFELLDPEQNPYILYVNAIAGGSTRSTKSIFGGRLRHSGGVIVNYQLSTLNADILDAGYIRSYSGFRKIKKTDE